ncbi:MAG: hypothetical protein IIA30_05170, partial [Myxococcales bacterium]|nr:hypothetical protein [Myxococcales bacterium]
MTVSDNEILRYIKIVASLEGMFICPEGAATVAALEKLMAEGTLQTDESIAEYLPLAKTAIIYMRRITATDVEARKAATFDPTATAEIENRLQPFQDLMGQPWYAEVRAATPPLLSELLTVQRAEQLILRDYDLALPERTYDEKFGIL